MSARQPYTEYGLVYLVTAFTMYIIRIEMVQQ